VTAAGRALLINDAYGAIVTVVIARMSNWWPVD
jgi:hypothetical protein